MEDIKFIKGSDIDPIIVALESIQIHGSADVGTMSNVFTYLANLRESLESQNKDIIERLNKKEGNNDDAKK